MCLVLMWRFHSFFEVKAAVQLYCAKVHGNGRVTLGPALESRRPDFGSVVLTPDPGFMSAGLSSMCRGSSGGGLDGSKARGC